MNQENRSTLFGHDAERALQKLMTRLKDVSNGMDKLAGEAEDKVAPVARDLRDLHDAHVSKLTEKLAEHGIDVDESGSFMSKVHETVVAARSYVDAVDEDVMNAVRNGEQHVLNAFDDAINKVENDKLCDALSAMRKELRDCIERTRHMG